MNNEYIVAFRYINYIIHQSNKTCHNSSIGMLDYVHDFFFLFTSSETFKNELSFA